MSSVYVTWSLARPKAGKICGALHLEVGSVVERSRGGHSHRRNTKSCDWGHNMVTGSQRYLLCGHKVTKLFLNGRRQNS